MTQGQAGVKVRLVQDGKERVNLASLNFLGLMNRESVKVRLTSVVVIWTGICTQPLCCRKRLFQLCASMV